MMISPWDEKAELNSPDGKLVASIGEAFEIGMGAPTSGRLKLSNGMSIPRCNPSMVWSNDSRFLAVPQWLEQGAQCLIIISAIQRVIHLVPGRFRVLQLESFEAGVIKGIDSPVHLPTEVAIDINGFNWE
jgi:hypothetical protein